jgi:hypothetical protein
MVPWVVLAASSVVAKPWNGIIPGTSSELDVVGKFGEPSKTLVVKAVGPEPEKKTLVFSGAKAIKGTVQAQFKLSATKVVERIDVFPAVALDAAAIEKSYGPACDEAASNAPCFVSKISATKRTYYVYAKLGLAVFFKDDNKTVQLLAFIPGT